MGLLFLAGVSCVTERHKVTGRIFQSDIKMAGERELVWADIRFSLGHMMKVGPPRTGKGPVYLKMQFLSDTLLLDRIRELLDLLFDKGLLYVEPAEAKLIARRPEPY